MSARFSRPFGGGKKVSGEPLAPRGKSLASVRRPRVPELVGGVKGDRAHVEEEVGRVNVDGGRFHHDCVRFVGGRLP